MKIVHIIGGGDIGGAKTHVLYLLKELSRHIEVKLISLRPGIFSEDARSMGIDVEVVKSKNIFGDIARVTDIIRRGGYNVIHSHGAKANIFSLFAGSMTGLPTVTTIHSDYRLDYMHSLPKRITIGFANSIALRFLKNYVAVSCNFRDMLAERKFDPQNIYVLYNGIDFSVPSVEYSRHKLVNKYNLDIAEDDVIVGIAARLYPVKRIDTIIRTARLVKDRNPKVKFLIGGDGEDRRRLENLAASLDLRDTVYFLGWLDDPNELMGIVDISVLASISESFPYSVLEGARFKKATISTDVGGIPDLIENGRNGYLFKPGDCGRFAELVLELAADGTKRAEMGESLYEKAQANFSVESMAKTQMEIYKAILERHGSAKKGRKPYDAIISGYYGFRNIGDDALLMSIIKDLRSFKPDIRLMVLSKIPAGTSRDFNVASISRINLLRIFQAMKNSKAFIYGGGNLLQDNTSTRSLFFYLSTVWLAKKLHLKVMFYANGIGPLKKRLSRLLTKKIMNRVDVITLREELSIEELKRMGVEKPRILLTADAAMTIDGETGGFGTGIVTRLDLDNGCPLLGVSLRKYPGHEKIEHEKYESAIAQVVDHMAAKYGILPVLFPMQHPEDVPVLESVAAKMQCGSRIIREKLNVYQTYDLISNMRMILGMRLHALVFAAVASVPMVGLVCDPKIKGFLDRIRQPYAGDVLALDRESLLKLAEEVWQNRGEISRKLEAVVPSLKEKARENARVAVELITGVPYY